MSLTRELVWMVKGRVENWAQNPPTFKDQENEVDPATDHEEAASEVGGEPRKHGLDYQKKKYLKEESDQLHQTLWGCGKWGLRIDHQFSNMMVIDGFFKNRRIAARV